MSLLPANGRAFVWCFSPFLLLLLLLFPSSCYGPSAHIPHVQFPSFCSPCPQRWREMQSGVPGRPGRLGCHGCAMTPGRGNQMEALLWISFANATHGQSALPAPTPILPQASLESSIFSPARLLCHPSLFLLKDLDFASEPGASLPIEGHANAERCLDAKSCSPPCHPAYNGLLCVGHSCLNELGVFN